MDNGIKNVFVFDVDGTLMKQSESKIEQESEIALREISKYGEIVLASARPLQGIRNLISDNRSAVNHFVSLNGALTLSGILISYSFSILPAVVEFFLERSNLFKNLWFYTQSGWYSNNRESTEYFVERNAVLFDAFPLTDYQLSTNVLKITVVSDLTLSSIKQQLNLWCKELAISPSNNHYIEIHSSMTNKFLATKKIFNKTNARIFSFGDSDNDIELLKNSFFSCAVSNATYQAKLVANYTSQFPYGKGVLDSVKLVKNKFLN